MHEPSSSSRVQLKAASSCQHESQSPRVRGQADVRPQQGSKGTTKGTTHERHQPRYMDSTWKQDMQSSYRLNRTRSHLAGAAQLAPRSDDGTQSEETLFHTRRSVYMDEVDKVTPGHTHSYFTSQRRVQQHDTRSRPKSAQPTVYSKGPPTQKWMARSLPDVRKTWTLPKRSDDLQI